MQAKGRGASFLLREPLAERGNGGTPLRRGHCSVVETTPRVVVIPRSVDKALLRA